MHFSKSTMQVLRLQLRLLQMMKLQTPKACMINQLMIVNNPQLLRQLMTWMSFAILQTMFATLCFVEMVCL